MAVNNIIHTPNTVKLQSLTVATVTVLSAGNEVSKNNAVQCLWQAQQDTSNDSPQVYCNAIVLWYFC